MFLRKLIMIIRAEILFFYYTPKCIIITTILKYWPDVCGYKQKLWDIIVSTWCKLTINVKKEEKKRTVFLKESGRIKIVNERTTLIFERWQLDKELQIYGRGEKEKNLFNLTQRQSIQSYWKTHSIKTFILTLHLGMSSSKFCFLFYKDNFSHPGVLRNMIWIQMIQF